MTDNPISYAIPLSLELSGMFLLVLGVVTEIATGADVWHTCISAGSVLITAGSIIWGKLIRNKQKKKSHM